MMPNIPHIELTCASLRRPTGRRCTLTEFPSLPAIATQRKRCESVLATVPPCLTSCADPYYRPVRRTATPHPLAPPGEKPASSAPCIAPIAICSTTPDDLSRVRC